MVQLNLKREIIIAGFVDYQEYKNYQVNNVLYKGEPGKVRPMFMNSWIAKEPIYFGGSGADKYVNYLKGKGFGFNTLIQSFASALQALNNPKFIIVFRK